MDKFTSEAPALLSRDSSYVLKSETFMPDQFSIGEKALVYIHPDEYNVYRNFWLTFHNCKICSTFNCYGGYTLDFIRDACSDETQLSSIVSMPYSNSSQTNEYINTINSEYSLQLIEIQLFHFSNSSSREFIITNVKLDLTNDNF